MVLKVYSDRLSQPCRAVLILCKVNGVEFEEIKVDLSQGQHLSPSYTAINPMQKVPAITNGSLKLFESHAILMYICCAFPEVADHWYPADLSKRAKIHSVLDWHHFNLRSGSALLALNTVLNPMLGHPLNSRSAAKAEMILSASLAKLESFWFKGSGRFLMGEAQPSIADLSLVCEIMQLELLGEETRNRILSSYKKVQQWVEDTKIATQPYFDKVHEYIFEIRESLQKQNGQDAGTDAGNEGAALHSKI